MAEIVREFEQKHIKELIEKNKQHPQFAPGDTIVVKVQIGDKRYQNYEGVCIARTNRGLGSSFCVRKISSGYGVERVFPLYSPKIAEITVRKKGAVRRAKLYYLRDKVGKKAKIAEATSGFKMKY